MKRPILYALIISATLCSCREEKKDIGESQEAVKEEIQVEVSINMNTNTGNRKNEGNLAIPHLDPTNTYKEYYVSDAGKDEVFNYAVEWNSKKKGANWVAYEYDKTTKVQKDISRSNKWEWDTTLTGKNEVNNYMHSMNGFDKGHICAAMDRDYSQEAKDQTFYYSNCFPQVGVNFNQGYWNFLEIFFRGWCTSPKYNHVYVTKGGTLNDLLKNYKGEIAQNDIYPTTNANGYTEKGLPVPKYFFMAILAQKGDEYQAMGFLVEHKEYEDRTYTGKDFKKNAVSIDKLEEITGIDFFCNLPDNIENKVEAKYDEKAWEW